MNADSGRPVVGELAGQWSTNVGNAFFQLGARALVRAAAPEARIVWLPELPGYQWPGLRNPPGTLDPASLWDVDVLVALGPFLRPEFERILYPTLVRARERGIPVISLGTGMMDYSRERVRDYVRLLHEADIRFVATRDRTALERLTEAGLRTETFDGVDVAFWVPEAVPPVPLAGGVDVVLNFDKEPEPRIVEVPAGAPSDFEAGGRTWRIVERPTLRRVARSSRVGQFLTTWVPGDGEATPLEQAARVVRTDHRFNPIVVRRGITAADTLWTDIPEPYLNLYAATGLTLSNRVHACAATLAYGNRAMLFSGSPRAALLERVGAGDIRERPVSIDVEALAREKRGYESVLGEVIRTLGSSGDPS